ncbi:MAG: hypothetical protein IT176_00020 [Acidobacteria bacterium]|nr:hypothetical protein [Acidobacteriota bacterium]
MPDPIFAYIDPGTGSYVLQMAIAGALAASYAVRHYWGRLKGLLSRKPRATDDAGR